MSSRAGIPIIILLLGAGISSGGLAETDTVIINAQIGAQLVFNTLSGECVVLSVDPFSAPSASGATAFEVKTNAVAYAISATFGSFVIADYDLVANANYRVSSETTGEGQTIETPLVPTSQLDILWDESGATASELITVHYELEVDYTVPWGNAFETVVFIATPTF